MSLTQCKGIAKKLTALVLCLIMLFSLIPSTVFAWTSSEGVPCTTFYGDYIVGSDGQYYRSPKDYYTLTYKNDGTTVYSYHSGNNPYKRYMLQLENGESRQVYCIEAGITFGGVDYISSSYKNNAYFQMLPYSAQWGIMLVSLYGWQPGKSIPAELNGLNQDDFYFASQILIWEFQQQLRTSPTSDRKDYGKVLADNYYNIIKGRPAERAYNWILEQMANHIKAPSFASTNSSSAPTHTLEYNPDTKLYSLTLTDTNDLGLDLDQVSGSSDITVSRSGNQYTFTSSKMIESPVLLEFQKDVPTTGEALLIWGDPGQTRQSMMTGSEDPVYFYIRFDTETWGQAQLIKTSEDDIVEGIEFDIVGNGKTTRVTTGPNGTVDLNLMPGTYTVTEVPIDRYVTPASQTIVIESGQTTTFSFHNVLKKFRIEGTKVDAEGGSDPSGDGQLSGAQYGLYHNGELIDTFTTDSNGTFVTGYYICDSGWVLKEITPSEGYLLDETEYAIGAEPGLYTVELNTISSELPEQIKKGQIQLVKHIDKWDEDIDPDEQISGGNTGMVEQPEAGAEFKIYLASAGSFENAKESERDILVTDENGFCISKSLPYGRYLVTQSAGMEGQAFVPDFTVFIREDMQTYSYILNNSTITGRIRIEKHDAETGEIIPVSGIGFKVRDMSTGEFIQQTVYYPNPVTYEVFYTGPDGVLWLPDELPYGSFELVEVETAYGYVLDSNPVPFEVTGETEVITVVKENYPQMGTIKITKSGEIFSSVTENEGVYQPVYEEASLEGATFDIIAESDIVTGDGTVRAHKGDVVDTITTTTQGAESKPLYLGSYRIVEKESPVGMVACEDQFATLTYAGQEISLTSTEVNIYNQRQKLQIELIKSMETDALFSIGQAEEYKAVSFGLYAQTDLVAADGTMIPADGLIEVVNLNPETMQTDEETGVLRFTAQFASDLPIGSYYLQERSSDSQFVISQEKFPVVFEYQGPDTELVTITANEGKPIVNELIRGKIQGLKVDENGNGLGGANIGLFKPETTEFTEENALMVTKSADNGSFAFEGVPAGHWVVREIAPPEAFVLNDELHHVYIGTDEETIEIQIENKKIRGGVQLIKVDAEYPEIKLSGAVFEVYEDTNANKTLDAEDMLMGTMEEVDTGLYEMRDLAYNGYFVVEKQGPAQFKTDSTPYYFEIRTDGEMVRVSNADNGYFENEAMRGALKIIKTSSDGKKEGFTFHVESEELGYSETFVTDQNGEILIEGLRIGKYMVYEEKNEQSEGYVLPDPVEVEIVSEEVLEVHVHNDKVTIDVPQTGDKSDLTLWFVLLGVGAAGCVSAVFLSRKKHKAASDNKTSSDQ